jgi:hypothetical protein
VQPLGRFLFPPKVAQLLAEEHGMFDGFVLGQPPDPTKPPDGSSATYNLIAGSGGQPGLADATILNVVGETPDPVTGTPYLPVTQAATPWFPDPLSAGAALLGLPGDATGVPTVRPWSGGFWPRRQPLLVQLRDGSTAGHSFDGVATETVVLPPAAVYNVHISSALTSPSTLGVWQWILAGTPAAQQAQLATWASQGQIWMLSPYVNLRMVHAVRLPLVAPTFLGPQVVPRPYGATSAGIYDTKFILDQPSTSSVDVLANWVDPLDDPTNPQNIPDKATLSVSGHAFKLSVPDPTPEGAIDSPATVMPPAQTFAIFTKPGGLHDLGDTKHHLVNYAATGMSRFSEFFRQQMTTSFAAWSPPSPPSWVQVSALGLNPGDVRLFAANGVELPSSEFLVDPTGGKIALDSASTHFGQTLTVSYVPAVTKTSGPTALHVLASARPAPPNVSRVVPAWLIQGPTGALPSKVSYARQGNFLRVYLDRPWFSSGAGELLGVVTLPGSSVSYSPPAQPHIVSVVGLDPISLADPSLAVPTTPSFGSLAPVPVPPGRPSYANPPQIPLSEDPSTAYSIYPYAVSYDPVSGQWYADVQLNYAGTQNPPPGYFVRLALVRFQPYAYPGAEVSPVVLATFAQPVASRAVSITHVTPTLVRVQVSGPAYKGWRPPQVTAASSEGANNQDTQYDTSNLWSTQPYDGNPPLPPKTLTVAAAPGSATAGGLVTLSRSELDTLLKARQDETRREASGPVN